MKFLNNSPVTTEEFITVGQLGRPRGTDGEIYVTPLTDFPERFGNMTEIYISSGDSWNKMRIRSSKMVSGRPVLRFENINSPEDAARLTNRYLSVPKNEIITPPKDSFFIFDVVGCEAFDTESKKRIGEIVDVEEYPASDCYIIKTDDGKRYIIAAVKKFVKKVAIEEKRVEIDSSGLIEE